MIHHKPATDQQSFFHIALVHDNVFDPYDFLFSLTYKRCSQGKSLTNTKNCSQINLYNFVRLFTIKTTKKWRWTESNCRHTELQSVALPTELQRQIYDPDRI